MIDPFEELRGLEMHERLLTRRRGRFTPAELMTAAGVAGYRSLGWESGGELVVGAPADFVVVDDDSPRTRGAVAEQIGYAATGADVTLVVVDGREIRVESSLGGADGGATAMRSVLITGIGELVSCDGTGADGLGQRHDAAIVVEDRPDRLDRRPGRGPGRRHPDRPRGPRRHPGLRRLPQPPGLRR